MYNQTEFGGNVDGQGDAPGTSELRIYPNRSRLCCNCDDHRSAGHRLDRQLDLPQGASKGSGRGQFELPAGNRRNGFDFWVFSFKT